MPGESTCTSFRLQDYLYDLPPALIAQTPVATRDAARLLVVDRRQGGLQHYRFDQIGRFLQAGDLLVVNDTRVVPARLHGQKASGGAVELLVLDPYKDPERGMREGYECLLKSAKRPRAGSRMVLSDGIEAQVLSAPTNGKAFVRFLTAESVLHVLERTGHVPLPPYIHRNGARPAAADRTTYQTVYAEKPGAVAAPTAGLHFSRELLAQLQQQGVEVVEVTLHVGYGTFAPLRADDIRDHRMHPEYAEVSARSAQAVALAKAEKRRVIAVGTTVVRVLEWIAAEFGSMIPFSGLLNHYIFPGYQFRIIDGMITNFHLPGSSLILLVAAFAGRETILAAYRQAIEQGYRFYSYGDATLII